ncbi:hypothetical protein ABL840_19270 [Variovorax sp. NFACC27]|uniref:hypothetical protein n=1 Tax=unclassified Variovorax TaxID=663243 RepID=UPI0015A44EBA
MFDKKYLWAAGALASAARQEAAGVRVRERRLVGQPAARREELLEELGTTT